MAKLSLVTTLTNRGSTTDKDGRMLNAFAEKEDGVMRAVKRPAINPAFDSLGAGPGQLIFTRTTPDGDEVIVIVDDELTTSPSPSVRRMAFFVQPSESFLGTAISPSVVVRALNSFGDVAGGYTANVTLALSTNETGATLGGTVTQAAVAGVATFNNITLNRSGEGFKLRATSGSVSAGVSDAFNLPTQLVFTVQPSTAEPGETMDPIEVTSQDLDGNTDTNFTGDVTLSIYSASAAGELDGTLTVAAVAGVASFTNVEISLAGTYTLKAECTSD